MNKKLLAIYSDYLISQNHHATATGLSSLLNGEISHDQVSRFLRAESYGSKELWGYVKPEIHRHEQATEEYCYSMTLFQKKIIRIKMRLIVGIFRMPSIVM